MLILGSENTLKACWPRNEVALEGMDIMIICISGLSGSGKNSVGKQVADELGLRLVSPTFKTIASENKMHLMEFHRLAGKDHSIDKNFDKKLVAEASKGNCVVTTWLGPWMIKNADLRVWLHASCQARAKRLSDRDGMAYKEALAHLTERDNDNRRRYKEIYNIDIDDHSGFDLVLNTERFAPNQSAKIIAAAANSLKHKKRSFKKVKPNKGKEG